MTKPHWPEWHCPVHRSLLVEQANNLVCPDGHAFALKNGIPRFVSASNYADAFGAQWQRYRLTQLDSHTGLPITSDRARRCLGEALWERLAGKRILECGCGAGRFTEILLGQGAYVTSIDLSVAVETNQKNFPQNATHRLAQADILQLPFAPQQYDVVFCLGVVQHTPNPEKTMACLYEQVKPGGYLVFDHYTYNLSEFTKSAPLFRLYFRRLPPEDGLRQTQLLVEKLWPLHKMARRFYPAQALLSRLSPVLCYYRAHPDLSEELHREWAQLDTHDALTDCTNIFAHAGKSCERCNARLQEIECRYGGNGVEVRGRRPLT
jgi:SAM-dependent methyltransferase